MSPAAALQRGVGWLGAGIAWLGGREARETTDRRTHQVYLVMALLFLFVPLLLSPAGAGGQRLRVHGLVLPKSCFSKAAFGVTCPGCGLSRSFTALAHGDLAGALAWHRVGPALYLFFALQVPYRLWALRAGAVGVPAWLFRLQRALGMVMIAALLLNWVYGLL